MMGIPKEFFSNRGGVRVYKTHLTEIIWRAVVLQLDCVGFDLLCAQPSADLIRNKSGLVGN
jgi:hypothetical protein